MFNRIIFYCLLAMYPMTAIAGYHNEATPKDVKIIPIVQYEYLNLTSQSAQSSSAGILVQGADVQFAGLYTQHEFKEPLQYGFPGRYHTIDTLLDGKLGRHQYIGIFKSASDQPVTGDINTFEAAAVYGYEMINKPNLSVVLGGGIAVGNFGIEKDDGENWPLIPVPLVRVNYNSDLLEAKFEFLASPNLNFTLSPGNHMRLTGDFRMDQFRDARDIIFEIALSYRPYSIQNELGDFIGLSVGFKNDNYGAFHLEDKEEKESIETHYYSLFATVDVSVLKISGGYAFGGRSLYRETIKENIGEGFFISVQCMYSF